MSYSTLLSYYEKHNIDPVPIDLSDAEEWRNHLAKRRNLYERHLGIPLHFLHDRKVLEFGCNTGENALVLATFGARLTLVEPNIAQHSKLKRLYQNFKIEQQLEELSDLTLEAFESQHYFDLVICENFINCLPSRDEMLDKICDLVAPNCFGVVSFDDSYGSLIEILKRLLFFESCKKKNILDLHSEASYAMAKSLFWDDFACINTSRPFSAWWNDVLLNPFVSWSHVWNLRDILTIIEDNGCEFHSCSPLWTTIDHFNWYKNVMNTNERHRMVMRQWYDCFAYILTGHPVADGRTTTANAELVFATEDLLRSIENYMTQPGIDFTTVNYPDSLNDFFKKSEVSLYCQLNEEIKDLIEGFRTCEIDEVIDKYKQTKILRGSWGTPCQYISFRRVE